MNFRDGSCQWEFLPVSPIFQQGLKLSGFGKQKVIRKTFVVVVVVINAVVIVQVVVVDVDVFVVVVTSDVTVVVAIAFLDFSLIFYFHRK